MMLKLDESSIIYIACPANFATGGPELLHQLGAELRGLGFNVFMYYLGFDATCFKSPVHDNYIKYQLEFTTNIDDNLHNYLIIPEASFELAEKFSKINTIIWWLSVDNAYVVFDFINRIYNRCSLLNRIFCKVIKILSKVPILSEIYEIYPRYKVDHLFKLSINSERFSFWAQSFYAVDFLKDQGVNHSIYLSDYLREDFIKRIDRVDYSLKQNIVVYNPKKGIEFTKQIINFANKKIRFVPIVNMSVEEVYNLLACAKVYIDFGNHPGKDRIPREAAILGCCVITGLKGSAKFYEDVPIPEGYKFCDSSGQIPNVIEKISYVFDNYETCCNDFKYYKSCILNEEKVFSDKVRELFLGN